MFNNKFTSGKLVYQHQLHPQAFDSHGCGDNVALPALDSEAGRKVFRSCSQTRKDRFSNSKFFPPLPVCEKKNTIFFVVWGEARDGRVQLRDLQSKTSIYGGCSRLRFPRKKIHPLWIPALHSKVFHPRCENETFWLI